MHGGALATLIDTVVVPAIAGPFDELIVMLTLSMTVNYLGAIREQDAIAEGWVERRGRTTVFCAAEVRAAVQRFGAEERGRRLLESYKEEAVRSIADLHSPSLKGLLRRVVGKIFSVEIEGWCSEFETRNAASREAVAEVAG